MTGAGTASGSSKGLGALLRQAPWIIFALAVVIRLAYVFQIDASPLFAQPVVDGRTYTEQAAELASGGWLGGEEPFWQPPLYTYVLGVLHSIFPRTFFYAARFFQAGLGALTCVLTWALGRRLFGPRVGLVAGLAAALYGPLLFFDGEILPATLAAFLDLAGLLLLMRALDDPAPRRFAAAGAVFGFAALAVPTVLVFLGLAAVWTARSLARGEPGWRGGTARAAVFLAAAGLVIAPVTVRNLVVGGDTVLISWNGGVNFYIGNNPDYARTVDIRPGWEWEEFVTRPDSAGITLPSEKSDYFFEGAWEWIREEPGAWVALMGRKTLQFWQGHEAGRNQPIYYWRRYSPILGTTMWQRGLAFPFGLVAPLALLGLAVHVGRRGVDLPVLFALTYAASVILFFPASRYRVPVLPVLIVLGVYGAFWMWEKAAAGRWRPALLGITAFLGLTVASNAGLPPMDMDGGAAIHYNLGSAWAARGRFDLARESFARAVAEDSTYWQAWLNLGAAQGADGSVSRAVTTLERLAERVPERADVWLNLTNAYRTLGRDSAALAAARTAVETDSTRVEGWLGLIDLLVRTGALGEAEDAAEAAGRVLPARRETFLAFYRELVAREG